MKKYKHLTREQRYYIAIEYEKGASINSIAKSIGVSPSTLSREICRNCHKRNKMTDKNGRVRPCYTCNHAQELADERKERLPGNRAIPESVMKEAIGLLVEHQWSPEQISGYLARKDVKISKDTIYRYIHKDKENGGDLYKHCRHRLKHRAKPVGADAGRTKIPNRTGIDERPAEADGTRMGDFEMDLIVGKDGKGAAVTLQERKTNFMMVRKLSLGKNADGVAEAVIDMLMPYRDCVKTITTDNGSEFARHELITKRIGAKVYFADPYSSWQKGGIENINGLIRQYIPKKTDFSTLTDEYVLHVQHELNGRPRKKLGFKTPKEVFFAAMEDIHSYHT